MFLPALLPYINEKLCFFPRCYNTRHLYRQRIPLQVVRWKMPTISRPLSLPVIYLVLGNRGSVPLLINVLCNRNQRARLTHVGAPANRGCSCAKGRQEAWLYFFNPLCLLDPGSQSQPLLAFQASLPASRKQPGAEDPLAVEMGCARMPGSLQGGLKRPGVASLKMLLPQSVKFDWFQGDLGRPRGAS